MTLRSNNGTQPMNIKSEISQGERETRERIESWCADLITDMRKGGNKVLPLSEMKKYIFAADAAQKTGWKKTQRCSYPGCFRTSIRNSHTIPKGTLAEIAEDGHVEYPRYSFTTSSIILKSIGLNDASVFPGYCKTHEQAFGSFERTKSISRTSDLLLQVQRTASRELLRLKHNVSIMKEYADKYEHVVTERLTALFRERWAAEIKEYPTVSENLHIYQNSQHPLRQHVASIDLLQKRVLSFLEEKLNPLLRFENPSPKRIESAMHLSELTLPMKLPIALSGTAEYPVQVGLKGKDTGFYFLTVLPRQNSTHLIFAAPKIFSKLVDYDLARFYDAKNPGTLADYVEYFLIAHTDHWFLTPSIIRPDDTRSQIIQLLNKQNRKSDPFELPKFLSRNCKHE